MIGITSTYLAVKKDVRNHEKNHFWFLFLHYSVQSGCTNEGNLYVLGIAANGVAS